MFKVLDDRTQSDLQKTFKFILGKEDGNKAFIRLTVNKKAFNEKNVGPIKKDQNHIRSPTVLSCLPSPRTLNEVNTSGMHSARKIKFPL